jgi:hypothetical protein
VLGGFVYNHKTLESLFYQAGAVGEVPSGNCVVKCQDWLKRMHTEVPDPASVLGKVLEEFMEVDRPYQIEDQQAGRKRIADVLTRFGFSYHQGGVILGAANALPTKSPAANMAVKGDPRAYEGFPAFIDFSSQGNELLFWSDRDYGMKPFVRHN